MLVEGWKELSVAPPRLSSQFIFFSPLPWCLIGLGAFRKLWGNIYESARLTAVQQDGGAATFWNRELKVAGGHCANEIYSVTRAPQKINLSHSWPWKTSLLQSTINQGARPSETSHINAETTEWRNQTAKGNVLLVFTSGETVTKR